MELADLKASVSYILKKYRGYDPARSCVYNFSCILLGHGESGFFRKLKIQTIINEAIDYDQFLRELTVYFIECFDKDNVKSRNSVLLEEIGDLLRNYFSISGKRIFELSPKYPVSYISLDVPAMTFRYDEKMGLVACIKECLEKLKSKQQSALKK